MEFYPGITPPVIDVMSLREVLECLTWMADQKAIRRAEQERWEAELRS